MPAGFRECTDAGCHVVYWDGTSTAKRLADLAALPFRSGLARRRGKQVIAVFPSLSDPTLKFPVRTPAARYAASHLFDAPGNGIRGKMLVPLLTAWMGCDARTAAVIVDERDNRERELLRRVNERCAVQEAGGPAMSALTICTTRPVHLLFGEDPAAPLWVVRFGSKTQLQPLFDLSVTLDMRAPGLSPRPLMCEQWSTDTWLYAEAGIPGLPWFRWAPRLRGPDARHLMEIMIRALHRLHDAVRAEPGWTCELNLETSLERELVRCRQLAAPLSASVLEAVERLLLRRDRRPVRWFAQHGDFSPNNLLLREREAVVIDFEEFGLTHAPLHDEIGLALAANDFMQFRSTSSEFAAVLRACIQPTLDRDRQLTSDVEFLILHHLLNRLANCLQRRSRRALVRVILERLESFTTNPHGWWKRHPDSYGYLRSRAY